MKQQFLKDGIGTIKVYAFKDNLPIVPSSAIITIYKPGTTIEFINSQPMTIASDGLLSYNLTAEDNKTLDDHYKVVITYTFEGEDYPRILFYDVVNSLLYIVISDEDLINEMPSIAKKGWKTTGQATSGSSTTIVDEELTKFENDYFTGGTAYSVEKDESRIITDFAKSTGTLTTEAFGSAIATDKYVLTRSFTKEIQRAFEKIEDLLVRAGKRPQLVMDSFEIREVHIYLAVSEVCKGLAGDTDSLWYEWYKEYQKTGLAIFKALNLKYDDNEDGTISPVEETKKFSRKLIGRR
jgi:hypothetical protein